jgi:hypothetical protein
MTGVGYAKRDLAVGTEQVGKLMLNNMQYDLAPDAEPSLREYIEKRRKKLFFSNARSVRNAVDLARMAAANRVYEAGK